MSTSRIALATATLACCLFAGAANAVPYFPDRDTQQQERTTAQGGSYSTVFNTASKYDWQFGSNRSSQTGSTSSSSQSHGSDYSELAGALAAALGNQGNYQGGLNAIYDLLRLILTLLEKFDHQHNGGGNTGGTGNPEAPAQTPLPAPILLLGSGLAAVGLVVRRRRKEAVVAA